MDKELKKRLKIWADKYHTTAFIINDPISIPDKYRYEDKRDLEISAFLTAIMSFGNRKQIIKKGMELDNTMNHQPLNYLMSKKWSVDFGINDKTSFYRTLSKAKFNDLFRCLYDIYSRYDTMEDCLIDKADGLPIERLCKTMKVTSTSPQKKLNMFLRWMIRQNSPVDFGIWKTFKAADLIIPLDTHVAQMAYNLGIINNKAYTLKNARIITEALRIVFPDDPCLGDFALFGYGEEFTNRL
jgi:uncharacterized protein (TIGR02757 family)